MGDVYVKDSGSWSAAKEVFVKDGGVWNSAKAIYVKDAGSWVQIFPSSGSQTYTTAGTYSFTVPNGIYTLTASIVGGGGGGGGFRGNGDNHAGGAGGSGGFYTGSTISVTPGETLTLVVGAGGGSASFEFNGGFICTGTAYGTSGTYWNGTAGGNTSISRGATALLTATGGQPGIGSGPGDNCSGSSGAGGSPSGVNGGSINCNRNSYGATQGGNNGTGYGKGGNGNASSGFPANCPQVGGTGYIALSW